jgi:hypothetical protein
MRTGVNFIESMVLSLFTARTCVDGPNCRSYGTRKAFSSMSSSRAVPESGSHASPPAYSRADSRAALRSKTIGIRLSAEELEEVEAAAQQAGQSLAPVAAGDGPQGGAAAAGPTPPNCFSPRWRRPATCCSRFSMPRPWPKRKMLPSCPKPCSGSATRLTAESFRLPAG